MPDDGRVDALQAAVAGLLARVERLETRREATRLSPGDGARMGAFLAAVDAVLGNACWALPDVVALAVAGDDALAAAVGAIVGGASSLRSAGRFLRRCAGVPVDGMVLERIGAGRDGVVYVVRVSAGP